MKLLLIPVNASLRLALLADAKLADVETEMSRSDSPTTEIRPRGEASYVVNLHRYDVQRECGRNDGIHRVEDDQDGSQHASKNEHEAVQECHSPR